MKIEGVEKYKYAELTTESPECEDKTEELRKKLKGKARFVFGILVDEWGEGVTLLDGKYHISTDGQYWGWGCKTVGGPQPKSSWVTRFTGTAEEAQRELSKLTPEYTEDGSVCGFK